MKKREEKVQLAVCKYITLQYPNVIFNCDVGSGVRLPIGVAKKAKMMRSSRGYPDLFIAEARGGFHGLYIEIKKEGATIFKKNGELRKDKHLKEQSDMLQKLWSKGYYADFGIGFDQCKKLIDKYMNNESN